MNPRERTLAIALLGVVVVLGGGFLLLKMLIEPIRDKDGGITLMRQEIEKKRDEIRKIQAEKAKLERWKQMSLPADVDLAQREYEKYLSDLVRQSKFAAGVSRVIPPQQIDTRSGLVPGKKEPVYIKLTYTVETHGDLLSLSSFLERFYRTGLLHQIKNIALQRPLTGGTGQRADGLDIKLVVEALVLQGADPRAYLAPVDQRLLVMDALNGMRRGPVGLSLVPAVAGPGGPLGGRKLAETSRQYASIAGKNIFYGPPPPPVVVEKAPPPPTDKTDVTQYVVVTDITHEANKVEAFYLNHYSGGPKTRMRASPGFDTFRIRDAQGETVVQGKVLRLADRDVIFLANGKHYAWHVGQTLKECLAKPLKDEELKELGIKPVSKSPEPPDKKPEPEPKSPDPANKKPEPADTPDEEE
ncbi:MAG: hypothetical protein JNM56_09840 [Planctomycetia bacterium]|nr:hypothetical protein [Planctomycetia bacterium]